MWQNFSICKCVDVDNIDITVCGGIAHWKNLISKWWLVTFNISRQHVIQWGHHSGELQINFHYVEEEKISGVPQLKHLLHKRGCEKIGKTAQRFTHCYHAYWRTEASFSQLHLMSAKFPSPTRPFNLPSPKSNFTPMNTCMQAHTKLQKSLQICTRNLGKTRGCSKLACARTPGTMISQVQKMLHCFACLWLELVKHKTLVARHGQTATVLLHALCYCVAAWLCSVSYIAGIAAKAIDNPLTQEIVQCTWILIFMYQNMTHLLVYRRRCRFEPI